MREPQATVSLEWLSTDTPPPPPRVPRPGPLGGQSFLEPPNIRLYLRAAEVYRALRERGRTVRSTVDCIIAAIAEQSGCELLARDRDMDAILDSELLKLRRWQPASSRR